MKRPPFLSLCVLLTSLSGHAQVQTPPNSVGSLLPAAAFNLAATQSKDLAYNQFVLLEQNGELPNESYCNDGAKGSGQIFLRVQRYNTNTPGGKLALEQIVKYNAPSEEVTKALASGYEQEVTNQKPLKATSLKYEGIEGGKAGWYVVTNACVEDQKPQASMLYYQAWSVQGPLVVKLMMNFGAEDAKLAQKYQREVFAKLKALDFSKL